MILGICKWCLKTYRVLTNLVVLAWWVGHGLHGNKWLTVIRWITIVMSLDGHSILVMSMDGHFDRDLKMWVVDIKVHTWVHCEMWMYVSSWRRREVQRVNLISEEILDYNTKDEEWQEWDEGQWEDVSHLWYHQRSGCNCLMWDVRKKGGIWCVCSRFVCSPRMSEPWYRGSITLVMKHVWLFIAVIHHTSYMSYSSMGI